MKNKLLLLIPVFFLLLFFSLYILRRPHTELQKALPVQEGKPTDVLQVQDKPSTASAKLVGLSPSLSDVSLWKTYRNAQLGLQVRYPESWNYLEFNLDSLVPSIVFGEQVVKAQAGLVPGTAGFHLAFLNLVTLWPVNRRLNVKGDMV